MADDDPIVRAMAAVTLADKIPLYSTGLIYVLVAAAKDYPIWKLQMESGLQGHDSWPLCSCGTTDVKAERLMMQHLSCNLICEEGSADRGCAL